MNQSKGEKYPKLNAKIVSKSLKLRDVPIVVFGQNREDKSSLRAIEYLIDSNIVNVIEYSGGIDDFNTTLQAVSIEFAPLKWQKMFKFSHGKNFTHLQMDMFFHLHFCHNRKNGFILGRKKK